MATQNVQYLPAPASPLPAIIDFAKYAGGQQQSGSGSQVQQGATAPLEALLAQISDPNNLANLVAQLFSQGAAQVPVLTSQFANATGTRVSNNSMLGQSLATLNTNIAQLIAQAVVDQQKTAAYAGGKIADTNKTTRSNTAQVQKPNLGRSIAAGAGTIAGGTLLNKLGDKALKAMGLGNSGAESAGTISAPLPVETPPIWQMPDVNGGVSPMSFDTSGFEAAFSPELFAPDNLGGDLAGMAGFDVGIDLASGIGDSLDWAGGFEDFVSELDFGFDIPFGFADGGRIRKQKVGYADGGQVRNLPNMGQRVAPVRSAALRINPAAVTPGMQAQRRKEQERRNQHPMGEIDPTSPGGQSPVTTGAVGNANISFGVPAMVGLVALAQGAPLDVALMLAGRNAIVQGIVQNLTGTSVPVAPQMPPAITMDEDFQMEDPYAPPITSEGGAGTGAIGGGVDGAPSGDSIGTSAGGNAATGSGIGGIGVGDSTGSMGGMGAEGDAGAPGGGEAGSGSVFADGGVVGKGKKSNAIALDTELIRATIGEVVLPVDVVDYIGRDVLDDLIAAVHTPVRTGTKG